MKKGIILNLKGFKLLDYVTQNKIFIVLCLLFVSGIIVSAVALSEENQIFNNAKSFLDNYIALHTKGIFLNKFYNIFLRYFIIILLYFLFGTSMFGVVIIPFLTLWQGIWFGALTSQLYSIYGIYGIAFNAIIIIPPTVIFIISCFFAAKHSIDFSLSLAFLSLPRAKPTMLYSNFKKYCINFLIIICFGLFCDLLEIVLNLLFLKFFNF